MWPTLGSVRAIAHRTKRMPPPQHVLWADLMEPARTGSRVWLELRHGEVWPRVLESTEPDQVVWSTLWEQRPDDRIVLDLAPVGQETALGFTILSPREVEDEVTLKRLQYRLNQLLYAQLRYTYGQ
jgi:hypothetical protein